jgi:hypothetical protein
MSDHNKFNTHLPRNQREFLAFLLIVSLISVNIIPVIITGLEIGFSVKMWREVLSVIPFLWAAIIVIVLLAQKPLRALTHKILQPTDSFNAHIIVEILVSVLMLSIILTIVGTWIGTRHISIDPIMHFFELWPRNFTVAFFVEMFLAQPIARMVLHHYHHASVRLNKK